MQPSWSQWPMQSADGMTSSFDSGLQRRPLPWGYTAISRARLRTPIPQNSALSQPPHSCHALHLQSWSPTQSEPLQPRTSFRPMPQPLPPGPAPRTTLRSRCWIPVPHFTSHSDQWLHSDTTQSRSGSHGTSLQGSVWSKKPSQGLPPCWASSATCRVRKRCPPPHFASQSPQGAQLSKVQSTGSGGGHAPDSLTAPSQGRPRPRAGVKGLVR
mmetsp:Transcript_88777/g.264868  ORF Transcript_88777/g.264868 Transcript_88777/m.264868 type:complete len:213 (+) Transcript_88777:811-1449(+)